MAANMVTSKTVVIIISDGWDTGMVVRWRHGPLRRMALCVIWLNPLLECQLSAVVQGDTDRFAVCASFLPVHVWRACDSLGSRSQRHLSARNMHPLPTSCKPLATCELGQGRGGMVDDGHWRQRDHGVARGSEWSWHLYSSRAGEGRVTETVVRMSPLQA
jgi:hypothetical protein